MVSTDVLGNAARVMKLAEVLLFKTDRKSLDAIARLLAHQRHDRARVDAPGKKSTERHFRHQTHAHRFAKNLDRAFARFFFINRDLLREIRLPVTLRLNLAIAPAQPMTGFEFANRTISGEGRRNAHEREIVIERFRLNFSTHIRMQEECTEL